MKNLKDLIALLPWLAGALAATSVCLFLAGALGMLMLAATLSLLEHELWRTAKVFNGLPWLYVMWRFVRWVWTNVKQQRRDDSPLRVDP